ncbi:helix-turn-helix domain-containing protein [Aliidiomarina maris]|uniref:Transcriptional regulator n=1 Tax=Aliidiomarina maris TaxID=531312 RepID=A0A327WZJ9_9GAMM|nr:helix-turn-helix domain-containing protein [Aliidiomarina maris]MCL5051060.1 helix-turn-helix domain-containing protein [Bacillota bacterium]RAJ99055.1 HTH-type transcriptional regulator/antitoxin HipB [Aliidiomarina maris]RUO27782.1 transcriptional regulator [Aliidiomarina maris]
MNITRPEQLSTFVKEYRTKQSLTQADVAELVGIRVATVSNFENKPETCKLDTVFRIMAALNLKIDIAPRSEAPSAGSTEWNEGW